MVEKRMVFNHLIISPGSISSSVSSSNCLSPTLLFGFRAEEKLNAGQFFIYLFFPFLEGIDWRRSIENHQFMQNLNSFNCTAPQRLEITSHYPKNSSNFRYILGNVGSDRPRRCFSTLQQRNMMDSAPPRGFLFLPRLQFKWKRRYLKRHENPLTLQCSVHKMTLIKQARPRCYHARVNFYFELFCQVYWQFVINSKISNNVLVLFSFNY